MEVSQALAGVLFGHEEMDMLVGLFSQSFHCPSNTYILILQECDFKKRAK